MNRANNQVEAHWREANIGVVDPPTPTSTPPPQEATNPAPAASRPATNGEAFVNMIMSINHRKCVHLLPLITDI